MHDSIADLLPILDQALADSVGVVEEPDLEPIARARDRIEARLRRPDDLLLVALAGGTGSGKSSLFNAIAGDELAVVGGTRPTTAQPLALVPEARAGEIAAYLEAAGVDNQVVAPGPRWLCLIDLPDTDSVVVDHRLRVEALLPAVDVVVWVVDPEKYRDAALHHGLISPLAAYGRQFVFALNQVDRLSTGDASSVVDDLVTALAEDGLGDPAVFPMAAQPRSGPALGVDSLLSHLRAMLDSGSVDARLLVELEAAVARLVEVAGPGGGDDFEARWADIRSDLDPGDPAGRGVTVAHLIDDLADEVGGPSGRNLRDVARMAPAALIEGPPAPSPGAQRGRRFGFRRRPTSDSDAETGPKEPSSSEIEIVDSIREILNRRARAQATISLLALEVRSLSDRAG